MGIFLSFKGNVKKGYVYIKPDETYEITLLFQLITRQFQDISNFSARRLKRGKKNLQSLTNILAAVALIQTFWYLAVAL